jgi:hypothetical protein
MYIVAFKASCWCQLAASEQVRRQVEFLAIEQFNFLRKPLATGVFGRSKLFLQSSFGLLQLVEKLNCTFV